MQGESKAPLLTRLKACYGCLAAHSANQEQKQQEDAAAIVPDEEEDEADDLEAQLARAM